MTATTVLVDAHRGASARYPENTLTAFEAAVACGADGSVVAMLLSISTWKRRKSRPGKNCCTSRTCWSLASVMKVSSAGMSQSHR